MTRRGRRSVVVAAVAVFLLCDVIGSALGRECNDFGCCYNSVRTNATQLTCNISVPRATVALSSAPKLEDVEVTQGHKISLEGDTVASTKNLRSLLFSDIQELILEANSNVQVGAGRAVSLTVRRVGALHLKTSAFFGWQSNLANVSIEDTEIVHIDQDAFPAGSSFQRVRIFNITSLTLETGAIRGTIGQLELVNIHSLQLRHSAIRGTVKTLSLRDVTAASCPSLAISGSIDVVSLHSVTLSSLESHCLNAGHHWQRLTLTNSHLGYLSPRSIHGTVDDIIISGCEITSAGPAAVSVTVRRLNLTTSTVGELGPGALQVHATSSVALHRVNVTHLRPDALSGLKITDTTTGGDISVSRLTVDHAEPGSLRFAIGTPVTLKDLLLPGGCVCSTPSWARQLLLGPSGGGEDGPSSDDEHGPLSDDEDGSSGDHEDGPSSDDGGPVDEDNFFFFNDRPSFDAGEDGLSGGGMDGLSSGSGLATERDNLLRQVEAGICMVNGDNISLSDFTAQYCGDAGSVSGQPAGCSAPLAGWWSYLGVVALTALLLVVAVLLVIAAGKYRRHRQRKRPERPEPTGAAEEGRLCSADGPADGGEQHGASPYCRPVLPSGPAEPKVLYSELAYRLSNDGQRTDKRPPAGVSQLEPIFANSTEPEGCSVPDLTDSNQTDSKGWCVPASTDSNREPLNANCPEPEQCICPPLDSTLIQLRTRSAAVSLHD